MTIDQYKTFLQTIPQLNAHLKTLGIDVSHSAALEDDDEEDIKSIKRIKAKKQEKANIEATSDEDEE